MSDAQPYIDIMTGIAGLLALVEVPAAIVVAPISLILGGIFGLRKSKRSKS